MFINTSMNYIVSLRLENYFASIKMRILVNKPTVTRTT
jgi:hypothetical protein